MTSLGLGIMSLEPKSSSLRAIGLLCPGFSLGFLRLLSFVEMYIKLSFLRIRLSSSRYCTLAYTIKHEVGQSLKCCLEFTIVHISTYMYLHTY